MVSLWEDIIGGRADVQVRNVSLCEHLNVFSHNTAACKQVQCRWCCGQGCARLRSMLCCAVLWCGVHMLCRAGMIFNTRHHSSSFKGHSIPNILSKKGKGVGSSGSQWQGAWYAPL